MKRTTLYALFLLLQAAIPLYGGGAGGDSCLKRMGKLLGISPRTVAIASIQDLEHSFPMDAPLRKQVDDLTPEARQRIFQLFSQVSPVNGPIIIKQALGRKKAIGNTLARVITEEGLFERLFLQGIRDYSSLSLTDKRALHLMLNKRWWFHRPVLIGGRSLYRDHRLTYFIRASYYIQHWQNSQGINLQHFLDETAQTPFWKKVFNRFSYVHNIHEQITTSPHSSDLLLNLKAERAKASLESRIEHLDHLIAIVAKGELPSPPRRFPKIGYLAPQFVEKTENFVFIYAQYYVMFWALSQWLTIDSAETTETPQDDTLPIAQWNAPVVETLDDAPLSSEDEILIRCNMGLIPEEKCLELLSVASEE